MGGYNPAYKTHIFHFFKNPPKQAPEEGPPDKSPTPPVGTAHCPISHILKIERDRMGAFFKPPKALSKPLLSSLALNSLISSQCLFLRTGDPKGSLPVKYKWEGEIQISQICLGSRVFPISPSCKFKVNNANK